MKYLYILLVFLIPSCYINYLVFESFKVQISLLQEFNLSSYKESTTSSFAILNTNYPNLNVTTIPMDHLISKYYFLAGDYEKSLKLIESGNKANPYLKSGSLYKAEIYEHLGVLDSLYFYSKDAFLNMPRTPKHYVLYSKALFKSKKLDEFLESYNQIKNFNYEFLVTYYVTLNEFKYKNESLRQQAELDRIKFEDNNYLNIAIDHYLYGKENVEKSVEFTERAVREFQASQYINAIDSFKEAANLNPSEYANFENIGICYYRLKKFKKAIEFFKITINEKSRPLKGKSELYLGLSFIEIGEIQKGCKFLSIARSLNIPESYKYISENCK